jgi:uncharacterized protein YndB with AHSA1/START domain
MTPGSRVSVRVTHRFTASAERVFDAWLDPANVGKWLFATPHGVMVRVEIDARVGGKFVITERRGGEDVEAHGVYLEIDRPRRLVFTLEVAQYDQEIDQVVIEIMPLEAGCELTLTHGMSPTWADRKEQIELGWSGIFEVLEGVLTVPESEEND